MSTVWNVKESDFPRGGTPYLKLRFALQYATLAPSSHNSQPWRFMQNGSSVTLVADRSRGLPVIDPYDREMIISCGAALLNLCVALAHFGQGFEVEAFPADAEPDVLAILHLNRERTPDAHLAALFPAISQRATNRGHFLPGSVPGPLRKQFLAEAAAEGVTLVAIASEAQLANVAQLITQADVVQFADPRFRRELAAWIHPSRALDGMPAFALGVPRLVDFEVPIAGMVLRTFDVGAGVAARNNALVQGSPLLLCFATTHDRAPDWLFTGQAMERVLLRARLEGYDASFLNQPVEQPALRERLRAMLGMEDLPQLLIRLGKGAPVEHTPRRPVGDVAT